MNKDLIINKIVKDLPVKEIHAPFAIVEAEEVIKNVQ